MRTDHILKTPLLLRSHSYTTLHHQHHREQQKNFSTAAPTTVTQTAKNLGFLWRGSSEQKLLHAEPTPEELREGSNIIRNQLSSVKRLFMSPKATKSERLSSSATTGDAKLMSLYEMRRPLTQMNKLRGLFSGYREPATADANESFNNSMENSNSNNSHAEVASSASTLANKSTARNLSLLNVSTFK